MTEKFPIPLKLQGKDPIVKKRFDSKLTAVFDSENSSILCIIQ